jgi:oligoribonuclease NrnB/cAMP/cGMP phosphodiesterase (DHH superfamily)
MESGNGSFMFIPTDKYISIDKDAAEALKKEISEDLVDEKLTYIMNTALVEKYGEIISELIENCDDIPEKDKEELISATIKYEIKKGTIQELTSKYGERTVKEMLEIIRPVYQVKNIKDKSKDVE